jgi:hypothetical protein
MKSIKITPIKQRDASACGPTCIHIVELAKVAKLYKKNVEWFLK